MLNLTNNGLRHEQLNAFLHSIPTDAYNLSSHILITHLIARVTDEDFTEALDLTRQAIAKRLTKQPTPPVR